MSGLLVGMYYNYIDPAMSFQATLKGVVAQVVGGVGNVPGAIVGSLLLGLVESYGIALFGTSYRNLFAFVLLVVVLVLRPNGLFASAPADAARAADRHLHRAEQAGAHPALGAGWRRAASPRCCRWCSRIAYVLQTLTNAWLYAMLGLSLTLVAGTVGHGLARPCRRCSRSAPMPRRCWRSTLGVPVGLAISAAGLITAAARHAAHLPVVPPARPLRLDRDARRSARSCRW